MTSAATLTGHCSSSTPLLITDRKRIAAAVTEIARGSGVEIDHLPRATGAGNLWRTAPLVLIGLDAMPSIRRSRLPYRSGVIVVVPTLDQPTDQAWNAVEQVRASYLCALSLGAAWLADRFTSLTPR